MKGAEQMTQSRTNTAAHEVEPSASTKTFSPSGKCSQKSGHIQRLLDIDEVSLMLGVAKNTLYDWCAFKKIPHVKLGKFLRFDPAEIDGWIAAKKIPMRSN